MSRSVSHGTGTEKAALRDGGHTGVARARRVCIIGAHMSTVMPFPCLVLALAGCLSVSSAASAKGFTYESVAAGLDDPWDLAPLPDGSVLVAERCGKVHWIGEGGARAVAVDLSSRVECGKKDAGLVGLAVSSGSPPAWLVVLYRGKGPSFMKVGKLPLKKGATGYTADAAQEVVVLDQLPAFKPEHDGAGLRFGPKDLLYVATGDDEKPETAQSLTSLGGKLLRIGLDGKAPADNPKFPGAPIGSLGSIWAIGLHRPTRIAVDLTTGAVVVGDRGILSSDEVDVIAAGPANLGWPRFEGKSTYGPGADVPMSKPDPMLPAHVSEHPGTPGWVVVSAPYGGKGTRPFPAHYTGAIAVADGYQKTLTMLSKAGETWTAEATEDLLPLGVRSMAEGTDGLLYVVISDTSGGSLGRVLFGDTPPVVTLVTPKDGEGYSAGAVLALSATATDVEDGAIESGFAWTVTLQGPGGEAGPVVETKTFQGKSASYAVPADAAIDGRLTVRVSVKDSAGTVAEAHRTLQPSVGEVTLSATPGGFTLTVDGATVTPPITRTWIAGKRVPVSCPEEATLGAAKDLYVFDTWSDGGAREHDYIVQGGKPTLTCAMRVYGAPAKDAGGTGSAFPEPPPATGGGGASSSGESGCAPTTEPERSAAVLLLLAALALVLRRRRA